MPSSLTTPAKSSIAVRIIPQQTARAMTQTTVMYRTALLPCCPAWCSACWMHRQPGRPRFFQWTDACYMALLLVGAPGSLSYCNGQCSDQLCCGGKSCPATNADGGCTLNWDDDFPDKCCGTVRLQKAVRLDLLHQPNVALSRIAAVPQQTFAARFLCASHESG